MGSVRLAERFGEGSHKYLYAGERTGNRRPFGQRIEKHVFVLCGFHQEAAAITTAGRIILAVDPDPGFASNRSSSSETMPSPL